MGKSLLGRFKLLSAVCTPSRSEREAKMALWNQGFPTVESVAELVEAVLNEVLKRRGTILFPRGAPQDPFERIIAAVLLVRSLGPNDAALLKTEIDLHCSRGLHNRALAILIHVLRTPNPSARGSRQVAMAV